MCGKNPVGRAKEVNMRRTDDSAGIIDEINASQLMGALTIARSPRQLGLHSFFEKGQARRDGEWNRDEGDSHGECAWPDSQAPRPGLDGNRTTQTV
jgi:hypothetical protein